MTALLVVGFAAVLGAYTLLALERRPRALRRPIPVDTPRLHRR